MNVNKKKGKTINKIKSKIFKLIIRTIIKQ